MRGSRRAPSFAYLWAVGGDELVLAVGEGPLPRVAARPGTALLHRQIAATHRRDSFGRRHPPQRFKPRRTLGGCAREEFGEGAGTHWWVRKVDGSAGPPRGGPPGAPGKPRAARRARPRARGRAGA